MELATALEELNKAKATIEIVTDENARLREAVVWALGYTDFRAREHGEGPYWWRVELRLRSKLTGEQIDATLAALRRAKAEVLELAARELCMYCNDPGNWAPMSNSGYHQGNTPGPNMTRCGATKIHALRRELDARAAQIEEGE